MCKQSLLLYLLTHVLTHRAKNKFGFHVIVLASIHVHVCHLHCRQAKPYTSMFNAFYPEGRRNAPIHFMQQIQSYGVHVSGGGTATKINIVAAFSEIRVTSLTG